MASSEGQRRPGFQTGQGYYQPGPNTGRAAAAGGATGAQGMNHGETSSCCKNCTKPVEKFDKCVLIREDPIGQPGAFGCVIKAILNVNNPKIGGPVVVKMFHAPIGKNRYSVFQDMFNLQHRNLIKFLGIVDNDPNDCPQLIFKCASAGNLLDFVKRDLSTPLDAEGQLYNLALDVVNGMEYLHSMDFIHGCLSARNVLLHEFGKSGQIHAQISDYGMTRVTAGNGVNYFNYMTGKSMPIRWLAKECIPVDKNPGEITKPSDAWSFAVVLWEMLTRGDTPYGSYGTVSNLEVKQHILNGSSPLAFQRPDNCPAFLLRVMKSLFVVDPEQRPTFEVLKKRFEDEIQFESKIPEPSTRFRGSSTNSRNYNRDNSSSSGRNHSNRGFRGARGGIPRGRGGRGSQSGIPSNNGDVVNFGDHVPNPNLRNFAEFHAEVMQRMREREARESNSHQGEESARGNRGSRGNRGRSRLPQGQSRNDGKHSNNSDASQNQNKLKVVPAPGHRGGRNRSPRPRPADVAPPPNYQNIQETNPPPYSEIDTTTPRRNQVVRNEEDNTSANKPAELLDPHDVEFLKIHQQMKFLEKHYEKKKRDFEELEKKRAAKLAEQREQSEQANKQAALEEKRKLAAEMVRQNLQKQRDAELKEAERRTKLMQSEHQEMQAQEDGRRQEVKSYYQFDPSKSTEFMLLVEAQRKEYNEIKQKEAKEKEETLRQQALDENEAHKKEEVRKQKEAKEKEDEETRRQQQAFEDEEIARLAALRREKNIRVLEENRRKQAELKDEVEARRLQDELDRKIAQEKRDAEHARQMHEQELLEWEEKQEQEKQRAIEANERRKKAELEERRREHALFQEQQRNNVAQAQAYGQPRDFLQTGRANPITRSRLSDPQAQAYGQNRDPVFHPQPRTTDPIPIPPNRNDANNGRGGQPQNPKPKESCSIM